MDIIADVPLETLHKENLKLDETVHKKMSETPIFNILEKQEKVTYVAGGCSYNTMRVFNWFLNEDCAGQVGVLGSVGQDIYGQRYKDLLQKEDICPVFEEIEETNTGVCAVYCHNKDRGHVTDLGASTQISQNFFKRNLETIKNSEMIFTELFILKHRKAMVYELAEAMLEDPKKIFGFNIPSFYFIETYLKEIEELIGYAEIVFANYNEALFLGKMLGYGTEIEFEELAKFICKLPKKNKQKKRTIVITCGPNPVHVCQYNFQTDEITEQIFPVSYQLNEEDILDTNSAGDAFAGGFLSQFIQGKKLDACAKAGHYAAGLILQVAGCQIPQHKPNIDDKGKRISVQDEYRLLKCKEVSGEVEVMQKIRKTSI
jgi:adenosine kinase